MLLDDRIDPPLEALNWPPRLSMTAYTAEAGTASHDGLTILASWAVTPHQPGHAETAPTTDTPVAVPAFGCPDCRHYVPIGHWPEILDQAIAALADA